MTTLEGLLDTALPLNRKERYYTGTVLPALLCADSMRHLARLAAPGLLDLGELTVRADPVDCTVLFFTEYSLVESAFGKSASLFPGVAGLPKDTPDVVILVTEPSPVLIAIEAKLYDRPSRPDLEKQLDRQRKQLEPVCERMAANLGVSEVRLAHCALLPQPLADAMHGLSTKIITWEQIRDTYSDVDQTYFHGVLALAIARYSDLVSRWQGYQDAEIAGAKLVINWFAGEPTYGWMGAQGGINGDRVTKRIADGTWATTAYQCRKAALPGNPNWFSVGDFVELLRVQGVDVEALGPQPGEARP